MDTHIQKHTPWVAQIIQGRWFRIPWSHADQMGITHFPADHSIANRTERRIKTPHKSDLHSHTVHLHCCNCPVNVFRIQCNWFFTENVLTCLCRLYHLRNMLLGRWTDQNGVNLRIIQKDTLIQNSYRNLSFTSPFFVQERIGYRLEIHSCYWSKKIFCVQFTDPASAQYSTGQRFHCSVVIL